MKIIKVQRIINANTFMKRLRGYMFTERPTIKEVLILDDCNSIHTFNMKFDIDVLFLDEEDRVIKILRGLKRRKIIPTVPDCVKVVEAASPLLSSVELNECIRFEKHD